MGLNAGAVSSVNELWTEHRKDLEVAIHKEKHKDHAEPEPDLLSQEDRLRKRLSKLNMDMNVCRGDGNCLVCSCHQTHMSCKFNRWQNLMKGLFIGLFKEPRSCKVLAIACCNLQVVCLLLNGVKFFSSQEERRLTFDTVSPVQSHLCGALGD